MCHNPGLVTQPFTTAQSNETADAHCVVVPYYLRPPLPPSLAAAGAIALDTALATAPLVHTVNRIAPAL